MEQHWRPSQTAAWERLIQLKNPRTVMLYHYIESGFHTSRTRVCRVDLFGLVAALRSSKVAVLRDLDALSAAGLIAVNVSDRNLVTAYPLGSWASCVPRTGRRNIEGMLCRDYACTAVVVALSELRATAEHARKPSKIIETGTSLDNSHTNPRPLPVKDEERKGKEPLQNAPATPGHAPKEGLKKRPKIGRNPAPAAKVVAVTRAYLDICVPARMPKVNTDADGMPSPAIAKTVAKAIKANGAEYDWRGLFTQASRGAHLRGENDRQWRASLAWLCNPTYGDTSPPPPPGTRRSYPNFPE